MDLFKNISKEINEIKCNEPNVNCYIEHYKRFLKDKLPITPELELQENFKKVFINQFAAIGLKPPKYFEKLSMDLVLQEFINNDSDYYNIRMLVFQSCEYWKNELLNPLKDKIEKREEDQNRCENDPNRKDEQKNEPYEVEESREKIAFNSIYYKAERIKNYNKNDKKCIIKEGENAIDPQSFIDMLNSIEMMFPVVKPDKPENIYYQAMRIASNFHEDSADIKILNGSKNQPDKPKPYKKYHSVIRNFRNWSAHNKIKEKKLTANQFALLFCIALRTYFVDYNQNKILDIFPYEIGFFGDDQKPFEYDAAKKSILKSKWYILINELEINKDAKDSKKQVPEDLSFEKIIFHIGKQDKKEREISEIILGLFDIIDSKMKLNKKIEKLPNYVFEFKYENNVKEKFPEIKRNSEHLFLNKAYELIKGFNKDKITN